jgi:hypothetical protein
VTTPGVRFGGSLRKTRRPNGCCPLPAAPRALGHYYGLHERHTEVGTGHLEVDKCSPPPHVLALGAGPVLSSGWSMRIRHLLSMAVWGLMR